MFLYFRCMIYRVEGVLGFRSSSSSLLLQEKSLSSRSRERRWTYFLLLLLLLLLLISLLLLGTPHHTTHSIIARHQSPSDPYRDLDCSKERKKKRKEKKRTRTSTDGIRKKGRVRVIGGQDREKEMKALKLSQSTKGKNKKINKRRTSADKRWTE